MRQSADAAFFGKLTVGGKQLKVCYDNQPW
jgi:hypothetical protein